ncbi:MAG: insulinase family protein [Bdellovibrionales bacterium]|nr:insulinase family protein [Bdellovibrionales bacterium]
MKIIFLSLFIFSSAFAGELDIKFKVEKMTLENGMTVLLHQDNSVPLINYQQWFRVGSKNEKPGLTGLAHFFEHLMFKGTKKYPGESTQRLIQASGGSNNAFTSYDYTGYYETFPSDKLELFMDIESDRMVNLIFDQKEIDSEREVVKEEKRLRYDNSVMGTMYLATLNSVFKVSQYRWPVIGSMKDLNAASMKDFKNFYKTYYSPNNAVVVIAGDIDIEKTKKLVKKYYSKLESQEIPEFKFTPEPTQRSQRVVRIKKDIRAPMIAMAVRAPERDSDEAYAMDILARALGEGKSSRLYKKMVYTSGLASSADSFLWSLKHSGMFALIVQLKPKANVSRSLSYMFTEMDKLVSKGITEKELEKAKNIIISDMVQSLKTISGRARMLAEMEVLYSDYSLIFKELERYEAITVEDVKKVAKKYLTGPKRSIVQILPKK